VPQAVIRPVKLLRYVTTFDYFILVCEFSLVFVILYYIVEEAIEVSLRHVLKYLNLKSILKKFENLRLKNTNCRISPAYGMYLTF